MHKRVSPRFYFQMSHKTFDSAGEIESKFPLTIFVSSSNPEPVVHSHV